MARSVAIVLAFSSTSIMMALDRNNMNVGKPTLFSDKKRTLSSRSLSEDMWVLVASRGEHCTPPVLPVAMRARDKGVGAPLTSPCSSRIVTTAATIPNSPIAVAEAIVRVITHEIADRTEGSGLRNLLERRPVLVRAAASKRPRVSRQRPSEPTHLPPSAPSSLPGPSLVLPISSIHSTFIFRHLSPSEQIRLLFEHMDGRALKTRPRR